MWPFGFSNFMVFDVAWNVKHDDILHHIEGVLVVVGHDVL